MPVEPETTLVVAARETVAEGVTALTLRRADGGELPAWEPGAHIDLVLDAAHADAAHTDAAQAGAAQAGAAQAAGTPLVRQYSLCGDPADRASWRIAVLREPSGRGGSALVHDRLAAGSEVRVRGPRNRFAFEPAKRYRFVAGGIGITPLLPMIAAADAAGADWRLLYGGRQRASMAFLAELAGYGESVEIRPQDEHGLLDLAGFLGGPDGSGGVDPDTLVYCCGPEPLLAAAEQVCDPELLRIERFSASAAASAAASAPGAGAVGAVGAAGPAADAAFEVVLASSGRTLPVPADRSVLEVLEEAGVAPLSSCREGTCGTCETGVLEGVPDHRDVLLTPAEREANDTMFVCVSRSCGPRLVLDL